MLNAVFSALIYIWMYNPSQSVVKHILKGENCRLTPPMSFYQSHVSDEATNKKGANMSDTRVGVRRRTSTLASRILLQTSYPAGVVIETRKSHTVAGGVDVVVYVPEIHNSGIRKPRQLIHKP